MTETIAEMAPLPRARLALRISGLVAGVWLALALLNGLALQAGWTGLQGLGLAGVTGLWALVLAPVSLLVLVGLTFWGVLVQVDRPLTGLIVAARSISKGDYESPVPFVGSEGFADLAHRLNRVRATIRAKTEALDESGRLFQTMFEQVPCYISVQDQDYKLVASNKMFEDEFGHALGEYCYQAYKGRDSVCPECSVRQTFLDGQVHHREEAAVSKDGSEIHFLNTSAPIKDSQDRIVAVMEMATDVTAIRALEAELKRSEEKYRLFFNNDPSPVLVFDARSHEILEANEQATATYGFSRDELVGKNFLDLTMETDRSEVGAFLGRSGRFLERIQQIKSDGGFFYSNIRASYGSFDGRPVVFASTTDISRQVESDQQLIQAAKMATLGEMSAGVAHEINQPLSVIGTGAAFLLKQARRNGPIPAALAEEVAGEMSGQVERAAKIINHLREFGRKSEIKADWVDINKPIENAFMLLGQQLKVHDIKVRVSLAKNLPPIRGDLNRLEQVFINFILNARDAVESRREANIKARDGWIQIKTQADKDRVIVTVADNGIGIEPEKKDKIFEPFFTTKEVGKGTGLGLSISYGIVRDFGGEIQVESQPSLGTTFTLSFPVRPAEESQGEGGR